MEEDSEPLVKTNPILTEEKKANIAKRVEPYHDLRIRYVLSIFEREMESATTDHQMLTALENLSNNWNKIKPEELCTELCSK